MPPGSRKQEPHRKQKRASQTTFATLWHRLTSYPLSFAPQDTFRPKPKNPSAITIVINSRSSNPRRYTTANRNTGPGDFSSPQRTQRTRPHRQDAYKGAQPDRNPKSGLSGLFRIGPKTTAKDSMLFGAITQRAMTHLLFRDDLVMDRVSTNPASPSTPQQTSDQTRRKSKAALSLMISH